MKKAKNKKVKIPQPYSAIRDFLEKNGWYVVVIGGVRVTQGSETFNFHFECDFTGSKKK